MREGKDKDKGKERERGKEKERKTERLRAIQKDAGLCCGSCLRKGELFAYVGRNQNLKDLTG